jgi:hypothetical protein
MRVALLLAAAVILVRDPTGKWAADPFQPWFESLRISLGFIAVPKPTVTRSTMMNGTLMAIAIASLSKASGLLCLTMR